MYKSFSDIESTMQELAGSNDSGDHIKEFIRATKRAYSITADCDRMRQQRKIKE